MLYFVLKHMCNLVANLRTELLCMPWYSDRFVQCLGVFLLVVEVSNLVANCSSHFMLYFTIQYMGNLEKNLDVTIHYHP